MSEIEMEVAGGLCRIKFRPGVSTGPRDSDTAPGIGFELISEIPARRFPNGMYYHGMGVIGREDATRLRDALEIFLKNHAAGVAA
jgi:hypothetical protein